MSYLPQFKIGDCQCGCGGRGVEGRKVGKVFMCMQSYNQMKTDEQVKKANRRNAARNLGNKLRRENILGSQYSENFEAAERQALIHDLDFVHSRLVRMTAANPHGIAECFTCGIEKHWTLMQLSHFIKRMNTLTRWDLRANRCACKYCNETLNGNLEAFAQKLNEEQSGLAEQLQEIAREPHKWTRDELKGLLIDQRARLKLIETKFDKNIISYPSLKDFKP